MRWTASQLSRHCAHHRILADLNPRPTRDKAAAKGTAFHSALEEWSKTGVVPTMADPDVAAWLALMVDNHWAWPDRVELEVKWGLSHWGTPVAVEEKQPHIYTALDGEDLLTAGRIDAIWPIGDPLNDVIVTVDWKTGRSLAPLARENLQVNAAGIAICQRWKARAYLPGIYYAREARWDMGEEVERQSPEWFALLEQIETAAALDDQPHPGPHCSDCWERKNCSEAA